MKIYQKTYFIRKVADIVLLLFDWKQSIDLRTFNVTKDCTYQL